MTPEATTDNHATDDPYIRTLRVPAKWWRMSDDELCEWFRQDAIAHGEDPSTLAVYSQRLGEKMAKQCQDRFYDLLNEYRGP